MTVTLAALMLAPLAVSVALAVTGGRWAELLPPRTAVLLLTGAALVTALSTGFVLTVAGFVVVAQVPAVSRLGDWSARVVATGEPLPSAVGAACAVVSVTLVLAAVRRLVQQGRDLAIAAVTCRRLGSGTAGLVVLDDDTPEAYALAGVSGRVVVSTGMLRALPAQERRVLLAHEAAHLRHRHHVYVQLVQLAAAANPLLRPLVGAVHGAVERWADEAAADVVGDRALVARAVARATLASNGRLGASRMQVGAVLRMADSLVLKRTAAMLTTPQAPRRGLAIALALLVLVGAGSAVATGQHTESVFETARLVALATR